MNRHKALPLWASQHYGLLILHPFMGIVLECLVVDQGIEQALKAGIRVNRSFFWPIDQAQVDLAFAGRMRHTISR